MINAFKERMESMEDMPLFLKYQGQITEQPAYLYIDLRNGSVDADSKGEIGNSMSFNEFHNVILTAPINPYLHKNDIDTIIDELEPKINKLLESATIEWDGSNNVGKFDEYIFNEIIRFCECADSEYSVCDIDDFIEYVGLGIYPKKGQSVSDFAHFIHAESGTEDVYLSPFYTTCDIEEYLLSEYMSDIELLPTHLLNQIREMDYFESYYDEIDEALKKAA